MNYISFIIPSINRATLKRTIDSIELWPGDEVLVEFDLPPTGGWGNAQRNKAIARATGSYLAFCDDDDSYVKGHRQIMENAIKDNPGMPNIFKMQYPSGETLWKEKEITPGNIGSSMIFVPHIKEMLHYWEGKRNMADFLYVDKWKWTDDQIVWREEIISILGNPDGRAILHND